MRLFALTLVAVLSGCTTAADLVRSVDPMLTAEGYAREAVAQNQRQRDLGCDYEQGTWWSDDYASHREWASDKTPDRRRQDYDWREARLAECRQRLGR